MAPKGARLRKQLVSRPAAQQRIAWALPVLAVDVGESARVDQPSSRSRPVVEFVGRMVAVPAGRQRPRMDVYRHPRSLLSGCLAKTCVSTREQRPVMPTRAT
jgi:hypothetical protein